VIIAGVVLVAHLLEHVEVVLPLLRGGVLVLAVQQRVGVLQVHHGKIDVTLLVLVQLAEEAFPFVALGLRPAAAVGPGGMDVTDIPVPPFPARPALVNRPRTGR
jgi:hypothetical protein